MDFTVNTAEMYEAIRAVEKIAPHSSPIHVLKCAYIECDADTGQITLYSTNLAASIAYSLRANVYSSGRLLLEARMLSKILEMMCRTKRETVRFAEHMGSVYITSEKSQYLFPRVMDDYPKPSFEVPAQATTIEGKQISHLAGKCSIAAAQPDSSKEVLKSVHLVISSNALSMTSTDGQCISRAFSQEFLRLYDMLMDLDTPDISAGGKDLLTRCNDNLNDLLRTTYDSCSMTFVPLDELKLLA